MADRNSIIHGQISTPFKTLKPALGAMMARAPAGGFALAIFHRGQLVVDTWAGEAKPHIPWEHNTLALSYSTGKGALVTLVHRLVSLGFLEYDRRIDHYWSGFGDGSYLVPTLRQILCHESGLYDIRHVIPSAASMLDWPYMCGVFAQTKPRFTPGTDVAYQALSMGWLIGGLIEQVMQKPLAAVLNEYLVQPLQLDAAYFGVPDDVLPRVALPIGSREQTQTQIRPLPESPMLPSGLRPLTASEKVLQWFGKNPYDADDALKPRKMNRFDFYHPRALQACIPAANGVFSARSLAKLYAMLALGGELDGQRYLTPEVFHQLSKVHNTGRDRVMPMSMKWRLGYHRMLSYKSPAGFGHVGYNGSSAWCDPARQLSFAFVHNYPGANLVADSRHLMLTHLALTLADHGR